MYFAHVTVFEVVWHSGFVGGGAHRSFATVELLHVRDCPIGKLVYSLIPRPEEEERRTGLFSAVCACA